MNAKDRKRIRKEERERRKKLLRVYREDEQAKMWNKVVDEVGGFNIDEPELDCYTFDFMDPELDRELKDFDEGHPDV
jgi:hypothetical protein